MFRFNPISGNFDLVAGGGGLGTVNSVALSLPSIFTVSGSPVTNAGTLTGTLVDQSIHKVLVGPYSGADAAPTFRVLDVTDLPASTVLNTRTISTTAPLAGGGDLSTNRTLSIALATTSTDGYLSSTDWTTFNGKQPAGSYLTALTGDVTAAGPGSVASTIASHAVTNAKLAQMPANTIKGNNTGGTADALDLTVAQVNTMLGDVTTLGAVGASPNANGASISGNTLSLQPTDATNPGVVTVGSQTIAGSKTFKADTLIANDAASKATIGGTSSTAVHQMNGGVRNTERTITANLTIDTTTTDYTILCNQSGAISVTLPAATDGRRLIIKDISGTAATNNITITRAGSEKIEGLSVNYILQVDWGSKHLISNGTDWFFS